MYNPLSQKKSSLHQSLVQVGPVTFGGPEVVLIAGPCSVESYEQVFQVARTLKALNIPCMRGGVFKPRTSPYSFQGLGEDGLETLAMIRRETGLAIISEVMSVAQLELADAAMDCFQIGSRNMQNFELLKEIGRHSQKPVLLKRGFASTVEEFLLAAEYILSQGNPNVILCERGIRAFDPMTRNVLDLASVALLKQLSHLPVIVDPSHATGRRDLVLATSRAAVAVGGDGVMLEVHPDPDESLSDAQQAISFDILTDISRELPAVAQAVGRTCSIGEGSLTLTC